MQNHVFMGRGFPDYRQSLLDSSMNRTPDMLISPDLNKFYLDALNIYENNIIYNTETDWRKNYQIGKQESPEKYYYSIPDNYTTRKTTYLLDYPVKQDDNTNINYESTVKDIIEDINNQKLTFQNVEVGTGYVEYVLVCDLITLASRQKQAYTPDENINNLFMSSDADANKYLKVTPFRFYSSCNIMNLNPSQDNDTQEGTSITNYLYSGDLSGKKVIPLDVCEVNIKRLVEMVQNKNILPTVMDYFRQHDELSPYLNPEEASTLIPASISFRKFAVTRSTSAQSGYYPVTNLEPIDSISKATSSGNPGRVHPANVLSYFDLQARSTALNHTSFAVTDVYSILPVIN